MTEDEIVDAPRVEGIRRQIKWNDLTEDQKYDIALIAGFSETAAWAVAGGIEWEKIPTSQQDQLYLVDWYFYVHGPIDPDTVDRARKYIRTIWDGKCAGGGTFERGE